MDVFVELVFHGLIAACIYALLASGLVFIYSTTRVFHLAHGGVIALSAYAFWFTTSVLSWNIVLSALMAIVTSTVLGLVMNELVYEPLRRRNSKGLGYLIATIALLMISGALIIAIFGGQNQSLGFSSQVHVIVGAHVTTLQLLLMATTVVIFFLLHLLSTHTRFGKTMRATADNEVVASVLGIDTRQIRRLTFALGSALAGVAAIFYALEFNLDPNMGVMMAIKGFTAAVIGGPGSMTGAIVGSLLLSGVEQASVWYLGSSWRNAMAFTLLFIFLLMKPHGLFGRRFS